MTSFHVGQKFSSFAEFKQYLSCYENENFIKFFKRNSRRIETALRAHKTTVKLNPNLIYFEITYNCIRGGPLRAQGTGKRITSSCKTDCPAQISLRATADGKCLEIKRFSDTHNHEIPKTLQDWIKYIKTKGKRISSSLNNSDGSSPTEALIPLEERLVSLLGNTVEDQNGKVISSASNNDGKSKPSSDSLEQVLEEHVEEFVDSVQQFNLQNGDVQKTVSENNCQKKLKKLKTCRRDEQEPSEIFIVENEDRRMQARLVEAEERKADALQRLATSFESIAASVEFLCHSIGQEK